MQNRRFNMLFVVSFASVLLAAYIGNFQFVISSNLSPNVISIIVLLDLAVIVPLLFYWMICRRGIVSNSWIKPFIFFAVLIAINAMPEESVVGQFRSIYSQILLFAIPLFLSLLSLRIFNAHKRAVGLDSESRINFVVQQTFKNAALRSWFRAEYLTFYYFVYGWSVVLTDATKEQFSYHKKSGSRGMIFGITLFHIPSLIFTHVIVMQLSPVLATILTLLHLYSMYFFVAQANAMHRRFIEISSNAIQLRVGLMFDCSIQLSAIKSISRASSLDSGQQKGRLHAGLFGLNNVKLVLKQPESISVIGGIRKPCTEIILSIDEPHRFIKALEQRIAQGQ